VITYELDEARARARIVMSDELDDEEAVSWLLGFLSDPRKWTGVSGLIDTRQLQGFRVSSDGVQRLTRAVAEHDPVFAGSRWAIVANQDVIFGMARMYELLRGGAPYEIAVFRSPEEAERWMESARPGPGA